MGACHTKPVCSINLMFRKKSLSRCGCGAQTRPCQLYFTSSLAISTYCSQNCWQGPHTRTHTDRAGIKRQESSKKCGAPQKMKRDVSLWSSKPVRPAGTFNKSKQGHKVGAEKNGPGDEPLWCEEMCDTHGSDWTVPALSGSENTANNEIK